MYDDPDDLPRPLGAVVERDRGSLPYALLHGEPLVGCAAWAMGEAGIQLIDLGTPWEDVVWADAPFVLHDPLCPMTPPDFLAACVEVARETGRVVVGVRPVTDTVKELVDGPSGPLVGATHDRDDLVTVCSPLVLPAAVVAGMDGYPPADFADALAALRAVAEVELREAPPEARRVASPDDLTALAALTSPAGAAQPGTGPRRT
jgi:2-C-methyl-D-erythritol 4-phosphate cytidylyltransferase